MDLTDFPASRRMRPEMAPVGALMLTSLGHVAVIASTISAYLPGDDTPRLLWDYQAGGQWALLASDDHSLMVSIHATSVAGRPSLQHDLEGVDAQGRPVAWMETNRPDYWNNSWEWFTIQREEPLSDDEIAYPVRAWVAWGLRTESAGSAHMGTMKASSNRTRPKIARAHVSSSDGEVEVAYFTKRGRSELNLTGVGKRFYIQEVQASSYGSYWDTVEVAGNEEYAVRRAESLALTEGRSMRVARKVSKR